MASVNVSVIVPCYNGEAYLRECLDSILTPPPACSVEVICVNDGSTDGSLDLMRRYAEAHPEVTVLDKPNGGQSSARNLGMRHARGEYINFIDCDDYLKPGALDTLFQQARAQDLDILYYDGETFYEDEKLRREHSQYDTLYQTKVPIEGVMTGQKLFVTLREGASYRVSPCLQMIRRAYLERSGVTFREGVYYEDNLFTLCTMLGAERTTVHPVSLYRRRMHGGSTVTSHKNYQHARSYLICYLEMAAYTARNHFSAEVTRNIRVQLASLLSHARQTYGQLTTEERRQAETADPDLVWMKMLLDASVTEAPLLPAAFSWKAVFREIYGHMLTRRWFRTLMKPVRGTLHWVRRRRNPDAYEVAYEPSRALAAHCAAAYDPEHPFVSVVIPVYNTEKYLRATLDDLLAQTLRNFEVLLVDDGSTDQSVPIIEEYMGRDPRIKLLRQQNSFAGVARNNGIDHARGDYLLFLDSDDRFEPTLLALAYDRAVTEQADVVIFDADVLLMPAEQRIDAEWMCQTDRLPKHTFAATQARLHIFDILNPWTKLYSRAYIQREGFRYQPLFSSNDVHFTMMALACAARIAPLPRKLVHYRTGTTGNIQSRKDRSPLDTYEAFIATREQLEARGIFDTFAKPFAAKAAESMIRQMDTFKQLDSYRQLFDKLKEEGFDRLGLGMLTPADMLITRGPEILQRCCDMKASTFEQFLLHQAQRR